MSIRAFEGVRPRIAASAYVDETAVIIGDVEIGEEASVWPLCVVRGDVQAIRIGARSNIQDGTVIHVTHDSRFTPGGFATVVGRDVTVGHKATLHACTIGDLVLIGMDAVVMDGAVVEERVIVGAGSLVPPGARLASGHLYVGRPAKPVRALSERELEFLPYSAAHYARLAARHRACGAG